MSAGYESCADEQDMLRVLGALTANTLIIDIEPLVARWDGGQDALDRGVARVLEEVADLPGVLVVCFATNSARRPSAEPRSTRVHVVYLDSARKPARTQPYLLFPQPGVVVGDQVLTDGLLARRLGYTFVHYQPRLSRPVGPALLNGFGHVIRPLLFGSST